MTDLLSDASVQRRAARVRLLAMDVDGTLTDGRIVIGPRGEATKHFSVRDGFGLSLLRQAGIELAIVTGRHSRIVEQRAAELGISRVLQKVADKRAALVSLCDALRIGLADAAFAGDDWPDLPAMRACGFAAAPIDAEPEVRAVAHWVSTRRAGRGAIRELAETLLRAQGRYAPALAAFGGGVDVQRRGDESGGDDADDADDTGDDSAGATTPPTARR
ncbi:MAG: KdsC family phosphatase [Lautropia sp.]